MRPARRAPLSMARRIVRSQQRTRCAASAIVRNSGFAEGSPETSKRELFFHGVLRF